MALKVTVSGSFNRHFEAIQEVVAQLEAHGIQVLSPRRSAIRSTTGGFVLLSGDTGTPAQIETKHLKAIKHSDFLYVVNPGGYIGASVAMEIGYALCSSKPVFASETPSDLVFSRLLRTKPPREVASGKLTPRTLSGADVTGSDSLTLAVLQQRIARVAKERGYEEETLADLLILFVEEVGELARAVASELRLKHSPRRLPARDTIASELADCMIYLLHIANVAGIEMNAALRAKEKMNATRRTKGQRSS